jgi:hypothetical protein
VGYKYRSFIIYNKFLYLYNIISTPVTPDTDSAAKGGVRVLFRFMLYRIREEELKKLPYIPKIRESIYMELEALGSGGRM